MGRETCQLWLPRSAQWPWDQLGGQVPKGQRLEAEGRSAPRGRAPLTGRADLRSPAPPSRERAEVLRDSVPLVCRREKCDLETRATHTGAKLVTLVEVDFQPQCSGGASSFPPHLRVFRGALNPHRGQALYLCRRGPAR